MIRRLLALLAAIVALWIQLVFGFAGPARAGAAETIHRYDVAIRIEHDDSITVTERIDYDFGSTSHHGIFRDVPTTLRYDDTNDRVYPLDVLSVSATGGAPASYT